MDNWVYAAVVVGVVGAVLAWFGPWVVARIPEPEPEGPEDAPGRARPSGEEARPESGTEPVGSRAPEQEAQQEPEQAKELYADIAALPHLGVWFSACALVAGGLVGWRIGWSGVVPVWCYLVPLAVVLSLVDWRTRLLPTRVIAPSYGVLVVLTLLAAGIERDPGLLVHAGLGWLVMGGVFFLLWLVYPSGMGYGDVRLSGLLGIALGGLGWAQLITGLYASFLIGGIGGLLLYRLGIVSRKNLPFGPFMAFGALLGVLLGVPAMHGLGY